MQIKVSNRTNPVCVMLADETLEKIKVITDQGGIGFSDYIREIIQEKLAASNQNISFNKGE